GKVRLRHLAAASLVLPLPRASPTAAVAGDEVEHGVAGLRRKDAIHRDNLRIARGVRILVVAGGTVVPLPFEKGVGEEEAAKARRSRERDDHLTVGVCEV